MASTGTFANIKLAAAAYSQAIQALTKDDRCFDGNYLRPQYRVSIVSITFPECADGLLGEFYRDVLYHTMSSVNGHFKNNDLGGNRVNGFSATYSGGICRISTENAQKKLAGYQVASNPEIAKHLPADVCANIESGISLANAWIKAFTGINEGGMATGDGALRTFHDKYSQAWSAFVAAL